MTVVDQLLLVQIRMALDLVGHSGALAFAFLVSQVTPEGFVLYLVGCRLVLEAWLVEDGFDLIFVKVGDTDRFDQPSVHQLFHSLGEPRRHISDVSVFSL